jgi:hypothetical protein
MLLNEFTPSQWKDTDVERNGKMGGAANSKIPSMFDHMARNSSTIKSYYQWGTAQVMAARRSKGQLLVQLRGLSRWHTVDAVTIERPLVCPTGACDIEDGTE